MKEELDNLLKDGLGGLMERAAQAQDNIKRAQGELAALEAQGEAGAGMVKIVITGRRDVKKVEIAPSLLAEDKDMLEDLIAAAFNDANRRLEQVCQDKIGEIAAKFGLPPGFKLPF